MAETVHMSLRLPRDLLDALKNIAEMEERSLAQVINRALRKGLGEAVDLGKETMQSYIKESS